MSVVKLDKTYVSMVIGKDISLGRYDGLMLLNKKIYRFIQQVGKIYHESNPICVISEQEEFQTIKQQTRRG